MNQKQFDLFQSAVQWAIDEQRRRMGRGAPDGMLHEQGTWGRGKIVEKKIVAELDHVVPIFFPTMGTVDHATMYAVCSTAGCLAGNIVTAAGDEMVVPQNVLDSVGVGAEVHVDYCVTPEGALQTIPKRAQELAGLTDQEASVLFSAGNTAGDIKDLAERIADRHGFVLEVF